MRLDPTNAEQASAWGGDLGRFWADHAEHFDRTVAAYHERFMAAAAISRTDRVLDIGCGSGQTTRDAARAACDGTALGVDLSADMIAQARRLAIEQEIHNAHFEVTDVQVHPFAAESVDVAISRTGTMFFGDQDAAFANIARALRPRARLVLLVWQAPDRNEWIRELTRALSAGRDLPLPRVGVPGPFAQADPDRVRSVLDATGFTGIDLVGLEEPMRFGADTDQAHAFVMGLMNWMLHGLDDTRRLEASGSLRDVLAAHKTTNGVELESATWLVQAQWGSTY
jgi:SAM-dependent methyltransferase